MNRSVSWRDGVHLSGTPIWCDARRARDVCFVSHIGALTPARHGQLVATAETIALMQRATGIPTAETVLPIPFGRPFTLGTLRIELFRSGHCVGGASLLVHGLSTDDASDERVVYAGRINPRGGGLAGAAEVRAARTLVVSARYGSPSHAFPDPSAAVAALRAECGRIVTSGGTAVVLVTSIGKALDAAAELANTGLRVVAHRSVERAAKQLTSAGLFAPNVRRFSGTAAASEILIWPVSARDALDRVELGPGSATLLASGAASDRAAVSEVRADAGFPWSNQADYQTLLDYIDATGAEHIYLTDQFAKPLAAELCQRGRHAQPIGPPEQMTLF